MLNLCYVDDQEFRPEFLIGFNLPTNKVNTFENRNY
jgi:hypothetical protein